jgi:hypothetical protein
VSKQITGWFNPYMRMKRVTGNCQMNQLVNTLISALGISRRDQTTNDSKFVGMNPMIELDAEMLVRVVGGDGEVNGPRGGWKAVCSSAA